MRSCGKWVERSSENVNYVFRGLSASNFVNLPPFVRFSYLYTHSRLSCECNLLSSFPPVILFKLTQASQWMSRSRAAFVNNFHKPIKLIKITQRRYILGTHLNSKVTSCVKKAFCKCERKCDLHHTYLKSLINLCICCTNNRSQRTNKSTRITRLHQETCPVIVADLPPVILIYNQFPLKSDPCDVWGAFLKRGAIALKFRLLSYKVFWLLSKSC